MSRHSCFFLTQVLRIKENSRGTKPFQPDVSETEGNSFAQEGTIESAALTKLKAYASAHVKTSGAEVLTILAYDGDGVRDGQDMSDSTVMQRVDQRMVELATPPASPAVAPVADVSWPPSTWTRVSSDGKCKAVQQSDGNLEVIYEDGVPIWATGKHIFHKAGSTIGTCFQADGNLVQYQRTSFGKQFPIWAANCHNKGGEQLIMQNDGNLVIYKAGAHTHANAVW